MIAHYPDSSEITMDLRPILHPEFQTLPDGISEFTFANIYLFRQTHNYRISQLENELYIITGRDGDQPFFMLPFGLPEEHVLKDLFARHQSMKALTQSQAEQLAGVGYTVSEDRDNFDYLYSRQDLVNLTGRKFQKKKKSTQPFHSE